MSAWEAFNHYRTHRVWGWVIGLIICGFILTVTHYIEI